MWELANDPYYTRVFISSKSIKYNIGLYTDYVICTPGSYYDQ